PTRSTDILSGQKNPLLLTQRLTSRTTEGAEDK
ncbi:hypothetical protein LCGC14_2438770, partial [marine sediment metagenome]